MKARYKAVLITVAVLEFIALMVVLSHRADLAVFNPRGVVAEKEKALIIFAAILAIVVILPVFGLTFAIAWRYRASNTKARYTPDWDHNRKAEAVWWGIPILLILILSIVTWRSTHELDPFRQISSNAKPLKIQVVALQWKWLFIYPEQGIASVNFVQFPEQTPIDFEITADAPMNSFWIPQLGGQVYAMSGMSTHLHLMANGAGSYAGSSANLSGEGFADMQFKAKSSSWQDFNEWTTANRRSADQLGAQTYAQLAQPSRNATVRFYNLQQNNLYDTIISRYTTPTMTNEANHQTMEAH